MKPFLETVTERFCDHIIASTVRPATEDEIKTAADLHTAGNCPHNIVYDIPGWLYDTRVCYTCGQGLGVV